MPPTENVPENRKRVLSGMRPTGRLHIGHYFGALQNWIRLQNDPQYECFYFIADWHALTTDYADTSFVAQNTIEIATDWLAAGHYTIADIATFPWTRQHDFMGAKWDDHPNCGRWFDAIAARPSVKAALAKLDKIPSVRETAKPDDVDRFFGRGRYARA